MGTGFDDGDGLLTLWGPPVELLRRLDALFLEWAGTVGAVEYAFPPVQSVAALDRADYFQSFPHFATFVAPVAEAEGPAGLARRAKGERLAAVEPAALGTARYLLAPAACYAVYEHLRGRRLAADAYVTLVSPCARREESYTAVERQWIFSMREIVCVGGLDAVRAFVEGYRQRVTDTLRDVGFPFNLCEATDPFFDRRDPRILMQRLDPLKHEVRYRDRLAVCSFNFHRNFFGERFEIRAPDGQPAFSGCVAFGLERWLQACTAEYGSDWQAWPASLRAGGASR